MKLYNHTTLPDDVVRALLVKAARAVGCRSGKVLVEVNQGRRLENCRGHAHDSYRSRIFVKRCRLRWIKNEGHVELTMPAVRHSAADGQDWGCPLRSAEAFFRLARHEFAHVAEYHRGGCLTHEYSERSASGRRPAWAARPEEVRAEAACDDASALGRNEEWAADEILELALALEEKALLEAQT
jgi:hypothetical protein